jgi:protein-S-isoprenylcysteine O-methyltransferase Ste14
MAFRLLGTAIVVGELRGLLATAIVLIGLLSKMRTKEKFLIERFGPEYIQYKNEVKTLIPFVW